MEAFVLIGQTREAVGVADLRQLGAALAAFVRGVVAAGRKRAAFGQIRRVRHETLDGLEHGRAVLDVGKGVKKALGVGVLRVVKDIFERALLHDAPGVHNGDRVADLRDDCCSLNMEKNSFVLFVKTKKFRFLRIMMIPILALSKRKLFTNLVTV